MALLTQQDVLEIVNAIIKSGLNVANSRGAIIQFLDANYAAMLPTSSVAKVQLMQDLGNMINVERLATGEVPLLTYLRNVSFLLTGTEQQKVILAKLDKASHGATGAPIIDSAQLPETTERVVHQDDMVPYDFMERGAKAAAAVVKLRVKSYENEQLRIHNGSPMIYLGTGWLLTGSLLMTNHHVVNARNVREANAPDADLRLQAQSTTVQFDFDEDGSEGSTVSAVALEAWDVSLDYVVLRIPNCGRAPLRRAPQLLVKGTDPIAVNIIQHPGGLSKRYAIRNNLVSAATARELRYFTDTEGGSSGSPVFNDRWEVVALHRASVFVTNVQFQGRDTAHVNAGTQLPAIAADLRVRYASLADEIGF